MSSTPVYRVWATMKDTYRNPNDAQGKGVRVAREWLNDFEAFFAHVGPRPGPGYILGRIDTRLGFVPGNVRWATRLEQLRGRVNALRFTYRGDTLTIAEFAEKYGLSDYVIRQRIGRGWDIARAIETPVKAYRPRRSSERSCTAGD